jgi:Ca2+-binding EF-hand superfamily protein
MEQITNKVKHQLNAKGVDSISQLRGVFDQFDANQNGVLDKLEFEEMMSKLGVFLTRQELRVVFDTFDANKDGNIAWAELVEGLKSDASDNRLAVVKSAFAKVSGGQPSVSFETLVSNYNAPAHPRVVSREKKAETVMNDFVTLMGACVGGDGNVDEAAFIGYYADANAVLPVEREAYFIDMVLKTWGIQASASGASVAAPRLAEIEDQIFEKIRQRTHGAEDEGRTVRRVFKHFDLDGFGTIDFVEFTKAMETIGCCYKDFELRTVFDKYDKDGNGKLDYEEFAAFIAIKGSGNNPNVNPSFGLSREPPNQVLQKIRDTLKARGANGIRGLGLVFRRMDNNGDRKMDRHEFMWGLRENGHNLSPSEFERIFKYFDKNNDGKLSYDEFLGGIRGPMNDFRKGFVQLAFQKLDKTGDGIVDVNDLVGTYDVSFHPKYKSGEMSKNDILNEFMAQWDTCVKDGKVSFEEFCEYYNDVSASIDEDDYFELMMRNAWHIAGGEGASANTSIPRHLVTGADGKQRVEMVKGSENFNY